MRNVEENADQLHDERLEGMTEREIRARQYLLSGKGVKGSLHWFDWPEGAKNDAVGRLDVKGNKFYFVGAFGDYSTIAVTPLNHSRGHLYAVLGPDEILAEVRVPGVSEGE